VVDAFDAALNLQFLFEETLRFGTAFRIESIFDGVLEAVMVIMVRKGSSWCCTFGFAPVVGKL
jgi:hypothetical protein